MDAIKGPNQAGNKDMYEHFVTHKDLTLKLK